MSTSVYGIAHSTTIANNVVTRLQNAGFSTNDISVLFPDQSGTNDFAHEKHTKAAEVASAGFGTGGAVGGAIGLLAGIGVLAIPGVGPLIAAGPIMATLSGAAVGGAVGGLTGALLGLGIPEIEAKRYDGKLMEGNILISVHADDSDEVKSAKNIMDSEGVSDISSTTEEAAPGVSTKY